MNFTELLNDYKSGVDLLNSKISGLDLGDFEFTPKRPDAWTIKEHVIHLVDSEVNGFIRLKSIIAQPFSECYVMDEDTWTDNLKRKNEDIQNYIMLFGLIRKIVCSLVKDETPDNLTKNYFVRKYKGEVKNVTMEKCIELYRNHLLFHIEYIDGIKAEISGIAQKK
jgi:hypothetical protein